MNPRGTNFVEGTNLMHVVPLGEYRAKDSITVLTHLLQQARLGKLAGIALCARMANGDEDIVITDAYRRRPNKASAAATRMFWRSMQLQDEQEAGLQEPNTTRY